MFRSFWQKIKDTVYDAIAEVFLTQEEIDIKVENDLVETGAAVLYNDTPEGSSHRKHTFLSHRDALNYAYGIPAEYVTFVVNDDGDEDNRTYEVWVTE